MGLQYTSATATRLPFWFLQHITDNFSEERIIGRGAFGVVYKGVLDNGDVVAVKKVPYNTGLGNAQFNNELRIHLTGVQHPNIVPLVGYCDETREVFAEYEGKIVLAYEEERAICLEYLQGGSLDGYLSDEFCGLGWYSRFKIIKGVCEGLKYLHTRSEGSIYHLDLKPSNILLDKYMRAKLGDLGLSKLLGSIQTYVAETLVGTPGYMPPEYINWRVISEKFDIFSLGVLMIHVIAGQEGYKNSEYMHSRKIIELVHENWGSRLGATMSWHTSRQVKSCTEIALRCMELDQENRPTITEVVNDLNKIDAGKISSIVQIMKEEDQTIQTALIQDLCSECMPGESIIAGSLSDDEWRKCYKIIKGICGLKYLHTGSRKYIYHLDLKPDNVLFDMNMTPKIADFGLTKTHPKMRRRNRNSNGNIFVYATGAHRLAS